MKIKDLSNTKNKEIKYNRASITLRFTLIALILILSCYYLWVLYKAVTPNVSTAYKAYYIKTQTLFWQLNKPNLSLNIPSSLDVTKKSPYLSRKGWDKNADNGYRHTATYCFKFQISKSTANWDLLHQFYCESQVKWNQVSRGSLSFC